MKKTSILSISAIIALGLMSFEVLELDGIPDLTGGHGESDCTNCHADFAVNTGGGSVAISASPSLAAGYSANTHYTISVTVTKTGQSDFGFDFEALNSGNTANAGSLTAGGNSEVQQKAGNFNNMVHTNPAFSSGTHTFTFDWLSPASNVGNVNFYASGLAADGGGTGGDFVYTTSLAVPFATGVSEIAASDLHLTVFPNPVAKFINASYLLTENSSVSAKLISLNGQVVETFFNNEQQPAGKQDRKLIIDQTLASGLYFLSLEVNGNKNFKKIDVK